LLAWLALAGRAAGALGWRRTAASPRARPRRASRSGCCLAAFGRGRGGKGRLSPAPPWHAEGVSRRRRSLGGRSLGGGCAFGRGCGIGKTRRQSGRMRPPPSAAVAQAKDPARRGAFRAGFAGCGLAIRVSRCAVAGLRLRNRSLAGNRRTGRQHAGDRLAPAPAATAWPRRRVAWLGLRCTGGA